MAGSQEGFIEADKSVRLYVKTVGEGEAVLVPLNPKAFCAREDITDRLVVFRGSRGPLCDGVPRARRAFRNGMWTADTTPPP